MPSQTPISKSFAFSWSKAHLTSAVRVTKVENSASWALSMVHSVSKASSSKLHRWAMVQGRGTRENPSHVQGLSRNHFFKSLPFKDHHNTSAFSLYRTTFTYIIFWILPSAPWRRHLYYSHFVGEQLGQKRGIHDYIPSDSKAGAQTQESQTRAWAAPQLCNILHIFVYPVINICDGDNNTHWCRRHRNFILYLVLS